MKLLFDEAVEDRNPAYKFSCSHKISDHGDGLIIQNEIFKGKEEYLKGLTRFLLCMGIADYQFRILPTNKEEKNILKLEFFFLKELDKMQFLSLISADKTAYYTRLIPSLAPKQSEIREYNLLKFMRDNEIGGRVRRRSETEFEYIGDRLFDYLAVSTHYLKGNFDTAPAQVGTYPIKTLG